MTTVLMLERSPRRTRVEGILRWAVLVCLVLGRPAAAQDRPVHWLNAGVLPPGAIGSQRLQRGGPLLGYFQPVRIRAPEGARIALAEEGGFADVPYPEALVGMQIGPVYRLRIADIPNHPELEIFPTVEVIDRLYPPPCLSLRFPIPIELTQDELELAANGSFVTRIIYVEDPHTALPIAQPVNGEQPWIEAPPGEDPLVTADERGRAVAILRIGSRRPNEEALAAACVEPPAFVLHDPNEACPMDGVQYGASIEGVPFDGMPVEGMPVEVEGIPIEGMPIDEVPVDEGPLGEQYPVMEVPVEVGPAAPLPPQ